MSAAAPRRSRLRRVVLILSVVIVVSGTVMMGAAFAAVVAGGTIAVHVDEHGSGSDFDLVVPAAMVDLAIRLVPDDVFEEAARELRHGDVRIDRLGLGEIARALEGLPDAVYVEVADGDARVRVEKRAGRFRILVVDASSRVRVDLPARTVARMLDRVASA